MCEKRFASSGRWIAEGTIVDICDNGKVIMQVFDNDNIQNVIDLLNELSNENRQLRKQVAEYDMILRQHEFAEKEGFK